MVTTLDVHRRPTTVVFYKENTVTPGDNPPADLACYDNCPKSAGLDGMAGSTPQDLVYPMAFGPEANNRHDYTFADMMLMDGSFPVVLNNANIQPWGFNSGPLFSPIESNMAALACDWDPNQTCGWKAWNTLDEFYTWETGANPWNRYTAVQDGIGNFVIFDEPRRVNYAYPLAGTAGANSAAIDQLYAGAHFFLEYGGFGDLHGIPGKCIDPCTNQPSMDCSKPGLRWVPEFTIPAGSVVTDDTSQYLVKPLEMEQRMSIANDADCSELSPQDMSSSWPNLNTDWVNPNLPAEPQISDPPKVIGGEVQITGSM